MKIKDIKKYVIGFILGLSLVGGLVFAADSGSIGALFEKFTPSSPWTLKTNGIRNNSLPGYKIVDYSIKNDKISTGTISKSKLDNTLVNEINAKAAISSIPTTVAQLSDSGSYIKSGTDAIIKNLIITGNLNTTSELEINGTKFIKKFEILDETWHRIGYHYPASGKNSRVFLSNITNFFIPTGKYIASIKITGKGYGYGGACAIFVPNKLALSGTSGNMIGTSNLNSIVDNLFNYQQTEITPAGYCDGYFCFKSYSNKIYNSNFSFSYINSDLDFVSMDSSSQYYVPLNYDISAYHRFTVDDIMKGKDLKSWDTIYLNGIVSQTYNSSNTSVYCLIDVQYGELVY